MAISIQSIVDDVLLHYDVKSFGEGTNYDESMLIVRSINDILQKWSIDSETNPIVATYNISSSTMSSTKPYITVGLSDPTNDIPVDIAEIVKVQSNLGQIVYSLNEIPYPQYMAMSLKEVTSIPRYYSFDYQYPQGKIYFHTIPMGSFNNTIIYRPSLGVVTRLSDSLPLPDYWRPAILWNVINHASSYWPSANGTEATRDVIYKSKTYLDSIKSRNRKMSTPKVKTGYRSIGLEGSSFVTSPLVRWM